MTSRERRGPIPRGGGLDLITVGRVIRPHGLRGEVAIESLTDVPARFAEGSRLFVAAFPEPLTVATSRLHHGRLLVLFEGFGDRESADRLRGLELKVALDSVPPAPEGYYYHFELVGCRVNDRGEGDLGVVTRVVEDGGGFLLELGAPGEAAPEAANQRSGSSATHGSVLIPFVAAFVLRIDIEEQCIELDLPPGLIEVCAEPFGEPASES